MEKFYWKFLILSLIAMTMIVGCSTEESVLDEGEKFTSEQIDFDCAVVKWKENDQVYVMDEYGYLMYTSEKKQADALVNDVGFHFQFDAHGRLTDILSDLMMLHVIYDDEVPVRLYGMGYGLAFVVEEDDADGKRAISRSGDVFGVWLAEQFKTPIVQRGIEKILNIERNIKDSSSDFFAKHSARKTIESLMKLTDFVDKVMKYEDMTAIEVVNQIERELPDMGGVEYVMVTGVTNGMLSSYVSVLMGWLKYVQNNNEKLMVEREAVLDRPSVLFDMSTYDALPQEDYCEINLGGSLQATAGAPGNKVNVEYGVRVSEEGGKVKNSDYHAAGSFCLGDDGFDEISVKIPKHINIGGLKPQTTYQYRAYCRIIEDNSVILEDEVKTFTTIGELLCENDVELSVTDAFYRGEHGVEFNCIATASKPQIEGIQNWGIFIRINGEIFDYYEALSPDSEEGFDGKITFNIERSLFYDIDVEKHQAKASVSVGIWTQLNKNQVSISKGKLFELVYDKAVSVTFKSYQQVGDTYYATSSVEMEDGTCKPVTLVGMIWYDYQVFYEVEGAFFIDQMDCVINQYEYGPEDANYANGLIYSDIYDPDMYYYDGENSIFVRQLTCPNKQYTVEGQIYTADGYTEKWEWLMYRYNGQIGFSTNAIYYLSHREVGMELTPNYSKELDTFLSSHGY